MTYANPLDVLQQAHMEHLELCDTLERIADNLPARMPQASAHQVVQVLVNDLPLHHRDEEEALFPILLERCLRKDHPARLIERLRLDHATDESLAAEIAETLAEHDSTMPDAHAFGFMLRCFFECYRRHVAWENSVVLPLARNILLLQDLREMNRRMIALRSQDGLCGTGIKRH